MTMYRHDLPQLNGRTLLTDGGLETDLMFNHGIEIPHFAAHTLLTDSRGRHALETYLRGFLQLSQDKGTGFILDAPTWKAHMHWAPDLGVDEEALKKTNQDAVAFISNLRDSLGDQTEPIVLNGLIGPRGDAYAPDVQVAAQEAERYHARQIGWLADTDVDMVTALTFTQSDEAIGAVRAARNVELPIVVSFTVETDGRLPTGQSLREAIESVDEQTDAYPAYFMVNCAHADHFGHVLGDEEWTRRIQGLRFNASRKSHAELDECDTLDDGNPVEFGQLGLHLQQSMPWLAVFGGCCGSDLRHIRELADAVLV